VINFFRKKRREMADDNQFLKYGRYALGEIVLVVIGILIALQINSWNEDRLARREEKRILTNLYQEFEKNRILLDTCIATNQNTFLSMKKIMGLIAESQTEDTEREFGSVNFDQLLFYSFEHQNYFPSQHSLNELIQSGKMQYLKNDRLKSLLYQWSSALDNTKELFTGVDQKVEYDILPYLTKKYPLKDMDRFGPLAWKEGSRLDSDKTLIIGELEFENLIDDNMYRLNDFQLSLNELRELIDEILQESSQYD
jgi:hypothetical protein